MAEVVRPGLELFLDSAEASRAYEVLSAEPHGHGLLVKLKGVEDKTASDALAKTEVYLNRKDLPPAGPDEYYDFDIIGASVTTEAGKDLGRVVDIIVTGANDVYVVEGTEGEILVPAIDAALVRLDPAQGKMVVNPDAIEFSSNKDPS